MESERRQQEVGEAAGTGFVALEFERGRRRTGNDESELRPAIDQRLEVHLPLFEILDLVENQVERGVRGVAEALANISTKWASGMSV